MTRNQNTSSLKRYDAFAIKRVQFITAASRFRHGTIELVLKIGTSRMS